MGRTDSRLWRVAALGGLATVVAVAASVGRWPVTTDSWVYVAAAKSLAAGHGYHAPINTWNPSSAPRFPPGLSLLLAPAVWLFGTVGAQWEVWLLGLVLVGVVWWFAREIGGNRAAVAAAVLVAGSSLIVYSGDRVMADGPAAIVVLLALRALYHDRDREAGIWLVVACFLRLDALVLLPMLGRRPKAWAVALTGVVALAAFQWSAHGNLTGYTGHEAHFGFGYLFGGTDWDVETRRSILPNLLYYPAMLAGLPRLSIGWGGVLPGAVLALGGCGLWLRRRDRLIGSALWATLAPIGLYSFYFFQSARFMMAPVSVLIVFAGCAVGDISEGIRARSGKRPPENPYTWERSYIPTGPSPESGSRRSRDLWRCRRR